MGGLISRCWNVLASVCVPIVAVLTEGMVETGVGDTEGASANTGCSMGVYSSTT